ncbi:putative protein kinase AGC-MAST family [Helianthus anomalus]
MKYLQLCEMVDDEKIDITSTVIDEDAPLEDDVKDRTSIDDFEIIKPISRGAFGRVFRPKKKRTGDHFAIKVLKKADMIRKNVVESILADILISVRNPFVRTLAQLPTRLWDCRENLYLVMEYLNGGDLYSLLRNLGCLDEDVARTYIAEVVLASEYLHSLCVVHCDLKPDNLLIAHDGHIKLTDFGFSKVGLINSTGDLSGPAVSLGDNNSHSLSGSQQERCKNRSATGTPDSSGNWTWFVDKFSNLVKFASIAFQLLLTFVAAELVEKLIAFKIMSPGSHCNIHFKYCHSTMVNIHHLLVCCFVAYLRGSYYFFLLIKRH